MIMMIIDMRFQDLPKVLCTNKPAYMPKQVAVKTRRVQIGLFS